MERLRCVVERITYQNTENGYSVIKCKAKGFSDAVVYINSDSVTVIVDSGGTLDAKATVAILPGKEIDIHLTFDEDGCNGYLKIPFVGKIKIKNAVRI